MRGNARGLGTPFPLRDGVPSVLLDAGMLGEMLAAFDEVLAPVLATLDSLDAYFDPDLAPEDFLHWLAGWLGLAVDGRWPTARTRWVLGQVPEVLRWRGTKHGVRLAVHVLAGVEADIDDNGGVNYSRRPNSPLPGAPRPALLVRVPAGADLRAVELAIRSSKPAHVPHRVEVRP